jgi:DNA-directed RNA polymerase subunit RPC12/RpoP
MMEVNCLLCGHKVGLGDAYDDYEGEVKCVACGGLLEIKAEQGSLKSVNVSHSPQSVSTGRRVGRAG